MKEYGFEVYDSGNTLFSRSGRYPRILSGTPVFIDSQADNGGDYFTVSAAPSEAIVLVFPTGGGGQLSGTTWLYFYVGGHRWKCWLSGTSLAFDDWDDYDGTTSHSLVSSLPSPTLDTSTGPTSGNYASVTDPNTYGTPGGSWFASWWADTDLPGEYIHVIAYG